MNKSIKDIDFDKSGGLIPVIVQDNNTKEILTLAYSNYESLKLTWSVYLKGNAYRDAATWAESRSRYLSDKLIRKRKEYQSTAQKVAKRRKQTC